MSFKISWVLYLFLSSILLCITMSCNRNPYLEVISLKIRTCGKEGIIQVTKGEKKPIVLHSVKPVNQKNDQTGKRSPVVQ